MMNAILLVVILLHVTTTTECLPLNSDVAQNSPFQQRLNVLHPCGIFCYCEGDYASCSEHYDNLTYIPKLNQNIEKLNFSYNSLENVSKATFENISGLHIKVLWLNGNFIKHINENALQNLQYIKELDIGNNPISQSDLILFLHGLRNKSLTYLNLERLHIFDINEHILSSIQNIHTLVLEDNCIKSVDFYHLRELKQLRTLDLSYNKLSTLANASFLNLHTLKIRKNELELFPKFCIGNIQSNLTKLDLSHNKIDSVEHDDLKCFTSLQTLELISSNLISIRNNTFSSLTKLKTLILNHAIDTHGPSHFVEGYAFNNSALIDLFVNSLSILFTDAVNPDVFKGCTNLNHLSMSTNDFHLAEQIYMTNLLGELKTLKILTMKSCRLRFFPEVISQQLTRTVALDLQGNNIQTILKGSFENLKKLNSIDLGHNHIVVLDSRAFSPSVQNQLGHVNLAYNSFTCTCDNLWLIEWMKRDAKKFVLFPTGYTCGDPFRNKSTLMINAPLSELICSSFKMFPSIISVSGVFVIVLATASLVYRWRWHIRHYIYLLRYQRRPNVPNEDVNFIYDAFVLFCDDDLRWVSEQLMPKVEEEGGKRLCIHQRDFMPGKYIVDNIIESLEESRKVILLLSNRFSESSWCDFELSLVQTRALEMQGGYLVVILLENLEARSMTSSLYALLQTTTYITWPEEEQDQHLFWERIKASLEQ